MQYADKILLNKSSITIVDTSLTTKKGQDGSDGIKQTFGGLPALVSDI